VGYEDLEISQLGVGDSVNGVYRGQRVHRFPAFKEQEPELLARVFLDTDGGARAVKVDELAIEQIEILEVVDGDRVIVSRLSSDEHLVAKEGSEG
jgi:hypothetical protein